MHVCEVKENEWESDEVLVIIVTGRQASGHWELIALKPQNTYVEKSWQLENCIKEHPKITTYKRESQEQPPTTRGYRERYSVVGNNLRSTN